MKRNRRAACASFAAAVLVFAATLVSSPSTLAAPKGPHNLQVWLGPTGVTPDAWGKAKYKFVRKFSRLTVEVHGLTPGAYDVLVGGVGVGSMNVAVSSSTGDEFGRFVLDSRTAGIVAADPRGTSVAVVNQTTAMTELEAIHFPGTKTEEQEKTEIETAFTNTGVQPGVSGEAELKEFKGRTKFEVKVEGLAPGTYDLLVGGASKAQIEVSSTGEVELQFDSMPDGIGDDQGDNDLQGEDDQGDDDGLDLLLSFDPRGQQVAISLGGTNILVIDSFPTN